MSGNVDINYTKEELITFLQVNNIIPLIINPAIVFGISILFSLIVIIASYVLYDVNIYIVSLKCLVYFIIYIMLVNKKETNYYVLCFMLMEEIMYI